MSKELFKTLIIIVLLNLILGLLGSFFYPFLYEDAIYLVLTLLAILVFLLFTKIAKLKINYSFNNLKKAMLLMMPALILLIINVLSVDYSKVTFSIVIKAICISLYAAINEELLIRIAPINYYINKTSKKDYTLLVISTSIIFSLLHLTNLTAGANVIYTFLQVIQTFGVGILFSSVYVVTRNIYPLIKIHFLFDFFALLIPEINETGGVINTLYLDMGTIIQTILSICFIVVGIKYLRDNNSTIDSIWE